MYTGELMSNLEPIYVTILSLGFMVLLFVVFVIIAMGYLRYYFNRFEPIYTLDDSNQLVKNPIASRFCKIVISNTISNQCLYDIENIGLWMLASNVVTEWTDDKIMSINQLHNAVYDALASELDQAQYAKLMNNLTQLEDALNCNLSDSQINTPPYMHASTYALWATSVLSMLNK